jgi:O-acetyl-ADP-ribose deacetylase (regulator of RNase III)
MNELLASFTYPTGQALEIIQGDITAQKVDAIVNAANSMLAHGGGVAGIIARQGGKAINEESRAWIKEHGPVSHGEPAYTSGGSLPARYVIHAVGPVWGDGDEDAKLADAFRGSLLLADRLELKSIAFPAISTGIFGFPKERAAGIFFDTLDRYYAADQESSVRLIRLVLFDQPTVQAFLSVFQERQR